MSVEGELSEWVYAKSGIPQGSVLGPVLFVIFINDLPFAIKNCCKLFAEDTKLYRKIRTEDDITSLQDDINRLVSCGSYPLSNRNVSVCILAMIKQVFHNK